MQYKLLEAELKIDDAGAGWFAGYASTFANWDSVRERPVKGAFAPHLDAFLRDGFIALGHDWARLPIATPTEAKEDEHGLFLRADFHSTPEAQAARTVTNERIARGKSVKLSIGYEVLADEYTQDGRLLKDIKLYEVSLVTVPANQMATVLGAKGLPVPGMALDEHIDTVVAAVEVLAQRVRDKHAFRAKEGRALAERTRQRLGAHPGRLREVAADIDALLKETEPQPKDDEKALLMLEFLQFEREQAIHNGALSR